MTLQKIKHQLALEYKWNNFYEVIMFEPATPLNNIIDEVAKRYATECCKASLEKAADNAATIFTNVEETRSKVHKPSIIHESNIVLL